MSLKIMGKTLNLWELESITVNADGDDDLGEMIRYCKYLQCRDII